MKATKPFMSVLLITFCAFLTTTAARAGDISGQWRAEFDTQIGQQKYLFDFQVTEGKLIAKTDCRCLKAAPPKPIPAFGVKNLGWVEARVEAIRYRIASV